MYNIKCKHRSKFYLYLKLLFKKQTYFLLLPWYESAVSVMVNSRNLLNKSFVTGLPPDSVRHLLRSYTVQNIAGKMGTTSHLLIYVPK